MVTIKDAFSLIRLDEHCKASILQKLTDSGGYDVESQVDDTFRGLTGAHFDELGFTSAEHLATRCVIEELAQHDAATLAMVFLEAKRRELATCNWGRSDLVSLNLSADAWDQVRHDARLPSHLKGRPTEDLQRLLTPYRDVALRSAEHEQQSHCSHPSAYSAHQ